jgi:hypothetical protein
MYGGIVKLSLPLLEDWKTPTLILHNKKVGVESGKKKKKKQ